MVLSLLLVISDDHPSFQVSRLSRSKGALGAGPLCPQYLIKNHAVFSYFKGKSRLWANFGLRATSLISKLRLAPWPKSWIRPWCLAGQWPHVPTSPFDESRKYKLTSLCCSSLLYEHHESPGRGYKFCFNAVGSCLEPFLEPLPRYWLHRLQRPFGFIFISRHTLSHSMYVSSVIHECEQNTHNF